jgi:hypothetical protein
VRCRELGLPAHLVRAYPDPLDADLGELLRQITEVAGLPRAARTHRDRVEEQHDGAEREELGE